MTEDSLFTVKYTYVCVYINQSITSLLNFAYYKIVNKNGQQSTFIMTNNI